MNTTTRRQFLATTVTGAAGFSALARAEVVTAPKAGKFSEAALELPLDTNADVIVCGAGPAGVTAAITAARAGAKVRLFEAHGSLGGVWTSTFVNYYQLFGGDWGESEADGDVDRARILTMGDLRARGKGFDRNDYAKVFESHYERVPERARTIRSIGGGTACRN